MYGVDGFDIVIGNPPYITVALGKKQKIFSEEQIATYKVEPYVVAADVYSVAPHVGRGGWTWYTGAAGWMYRAGIEGILGIRREGKFLIIDPCIPSNWPGFEATVTVASTQFNIKVDIQSHRCRSISAATLDEHILEPIDGSVRVALDEEKHHLLLVI